VELPDPGSYAVGMVFLPPESSLEPECRRFIKKIAEEEGCRFLGWREVPVRPDCLGELSRSTCPRIAQIAIADSGSDSLAFQRALYLIRRRAEKEIPRRLGKAGEGFYICSLSPVTIVYKGMFTASQIAAFFPDLTDDRFVSSFAVVHQRYSTNTLPTWRLAQPFRYAAHNGEINTLQGNINRMRAREPDLSSDLFGEDLDKLLPIVAGGGSDSAIFDNVLELLTMTGRELPHGVMMMIPEAWGSKYHISEAKRAFYEYHSTIMEPWDGPAAMVFCDGRYLGATLDRNGLRREILALISLSGTIRCSCRSTSNIFPGWSRPRRRIFPGSTFSTPASEAITTSPSRVIK